MPIRTDEAGRRWVEMEFLVPGTPEEVWQAIATGPGNAAWFTRAEIDERVGGTLRFDFGPDAKSAGQVTVWEPPHRFGYVEPDWSEGAPPVATEITVAARSGGQCVVRLVHSLFASSDDWDGQMEGFEGGWPGFFEVLRIYLRDFAGKPAASFLAVTSTDGEHPRLWKRLTQALGLAGGDVGDRVETPPSPERLAGTIERVHQDATMRYVMLRLDEPMPGVALAGSYGAGAAVNLSMGIFFYGEAAAAAAATSEQKWRAWLDKTFATGG